MSEKLKEKTWLLISMLLAALSACCASYFFFRAADGFCDAMIHPLLEQPFFCGFF
jgi:hypothetical protein